MIDRDARNALAEKLTALVEGVITNDQFLQSRPETGRDRAVDEIWRFGDSLYSDIAPYRLVGRNAISDDVRDVVQRCILFLQSDLEYMWPVYPDNIGQKWLIGGWIITYLSPWAMFFNWPQLSIALFGVGLLLWAIYYLLQMIQTRKERQLFRKCGGDLAVWPFFQASDLERVYKQIGKGE
jgi:hypothetical protein